MVKMNKKELYRIEESEVVDLNFVLKTLKNGKVFPLSIFKGKQESDFHVCEEISYDTQTGIIEYTYQNCYSDNCNCVSHNRWMTKEITYNKAVEYINEYLKDREEYLRTLDDNKMKINTL